MVAAGSVDSEVISVVERRRRWMTEQRFALVEAAAQQGGSVAATADRHGVSRSLLFDWRRQVREGTMPGLVGTTVDPTFAPVRVMPVPRTPMRSGACHSHKTFSAGWRDDGVGADQRSRAVCVGDDPT